MSADGGHIIFVDDDESLRMANSQSLALAGFNVQTYPDARSAMACVHADFDGVIVSDIRMPEIDGLQFFRAVQAIDPDIPVILITGHADVSMAVAALKSGAHDFLTKPFSAEHLIATARRACTMRSLQLENRRLRMAADEAARKSPLVGETQAMVRLRDSISQIADANVHVIVEGETGTGKELVARMLHGASCRRSYSFVSIACGSAPADVVESNLFGDPTGPVGRARMSQIEMANKGTLFLDDADRLPPNAQTRMMQLLDDGVLRRSNDTDALPVTIRIIASCRRDLLQCVHDGSFREDLYYCLNTARLALPPLRERKPDVPLLFSHFVDEELPKAAEGWPPMTDSVRRHLIDHTWPGNARELKTFAIRFALRLLDNSDTVGNPKATLSLAERTRLYEESLIRDALKMSNGDVSAALAELKLPRKTFYDKLVRHGIDISRFRAK